MADYIILALVAGVIVLTLRSYLKRKKSSGGCAGCPYSSSCSGKCETKDKKE